MTELQPSNDEAVLLQGAQASLRPAGTSSATRVSQIDASRLETEFSSILLEELNAVLRSAPTECRNILSARAHNCHSTRTTRIQFAFCCARMVRYRTPETCKSAVQASLSQAIPILLVLGSLVVAHRTPGMAALGLRFASLPQDQKQASLWRLPQRVAVFAALATLAPELYALLRRQLIALGCTMPDAGAWRQRLWRFARACEGSAALARSINLVRSKCHYSRHFLAPILSCAPSVTSTCPRRCRLVLLDNEASHVRPQSVQVAFLYRGRYPSLAHRLSGMQLEHEQPNAPREVSFEYLNQQLLWGELQSFVVFLLPLLTPRAMAGTPVLARVMAGFGKLRRWQGVLRMYVVQANFLHLFAEAAAKASL